MHQSGACSLKQTVQTSGPAGQRHKGPGAAAGASVFTDPGGRGSPCPSPASSTSCLLLPQVLCGSQSRAGGKSTPVSALLPGEGSPVLLLAGHTSAGPRDTSASSSHPSHVDEGPALWAWHRDGPTHAQPPSDLKQLGHDPSSQYGPELGISDNPRM